MYVVNPEVIGLDKLYECKEIIANWLIYKQHVPLFGTGKNGEWYFAKTENLEKCLKELPLHLKFMSMF